MVYVTIPALDLGNRKNLKLNLTSNEFCFVSVEVNLMTA